MAVVAVDKEDNVLAEEVDKVVGEEEEEDEVEEDSDTSTFG